MFEIIFYRSNKGESKIENLLDELGKKAKTSKDASINRDKILAYINVLSIYGTRIGQPEVKHIGGDLWELRPLKNRIFFFYWKDNKIVLLHHFRKKSQKTPPKEIRKAKLYLKDFLERYD